MPLGNTPNASPWVEAGNKERLHALLNKGNPVEARLNGVEHKLRVGRYGAVMKEESKSSGIWSQIIDFDANLWEFKEVANG